MTFIGCRYNDTAHEKKGANLGLIGTIRSVEFDGCEYVIWKSGYAGGIAHKGNCSNRNCR